MKHIEVRARVCIFVSPWNVSTRLLAHSRIYNNINANNFHRWTKKISVLTAVFSLSSLDIDFVFLSRGVSGMCIGYIENVCVGVCREFL